MSGWSKSGDWPLSVWPSIGIRSSSGIGVVETLPSRGCVELNWDW
jgi:hypothetical protein